MNDYYGYWNIPSFNDHSGYKKVEISNNKYDVYNSYDSIVGTFFIGKEIDSISLINNFSRKKNIKISLKRQAKWDKKGIPLFFSLIQNEDLFGNKKDIVTEIYLSKQLFSDFENETKKYKSINFNKSIYNTNYWENYLIEYPLPLKISDGLNSLIEFEQ